MVRNNQKLLSGKKRTVVVLGDIKTAIVWENSAYLGRYKVKNKIETMSDDE